MRSDHHKFAVLHGLRLKSLASIEALISLFPDTATQRDEVEQVLVELARDGATQEHGGRWALTPKGHDLHEDLLAISRRDEDVRRLTSVYRGFLALNDDVKAVCSGWQSLSPSEEARRFAAIDQLADLHESASVVLEKAADVYPRFGAHNSRLRFALQRLYENDEAYFTSPRIDSFHTVWFECHEDFLLTLGRDRATERSF